MTDDMLDRVRSLPRKPGVYLFRDSDDEVLYVGKARSLRDRVRSYFGAGARRSAKTSELSRRAASVETFVVATDAEALLLESNLIKENSPRFNIQLRDDKTFPYVKVTVQEPFPRVLVTRRIERDGSRYFGPFTDVGAMRRALRVIRARFKVRSCHYALPEDAPERPCLDYHIDRCRAPCVGLQTETEYREMMNRILAILGGRTGTLKRALQRQMDEAAADMAFERAAEIRDVIRGLRELERRGATVDSRGGDRDAVGIASTDDVACCVFLRVREGRLLGRDVRFLRLGEGEKGLEEIAGAAVAGVYLRAEDLPPEVLVPADFDDRELIESILAERRGAAVTIRTPLRGRKRRLLDLATKNAEHVLAQRAVLEEGAGLDSRTAPPAAQALAEALALDRPPRNLVCFDISTLGGAFSVGSAVWLADGAPRKSEYRRFRIRETPDGQSDDYSMMQEIVGRYFQRRLSEDRPIPDLVVVDGGRGQLNAALHAMEAAGVSDLPAVALAKREEEVFRPGESGALLLDRRSPALHWLQRSRDEAHRFALEYNRSLRRRTTLRSRLAEIPGVGPSREASLLRTFGSVNGIRGASLEDLAAVPGIGRATARRVLEGLAGDTSRSASRKTRKRRGP